MSKTIVKDDDKELIDSFLNDEGFRNKVEADIGDVRKVIVDWENNQIRFFGSRMAKALDIDATLAVLRNQIQ